MADGDPGGPARDPARGLLLDVGGVVILPAPALVNALARHEPRLVPVLEPLGGIGGPGDDLWRRMLASEVTERAYWAQRSAEIGSALGERSDVSGRATVQDTRSLMRWLYAGPQEEWLQPEVIQLMRDVKAAGIPLGALTNDMADFHGQEWVDQQFWVKLFDVVLDASHTGVLKPDPRAFAAGAAALGLPPRDVVYLDDMPWNVEAGLAAGLQAIRVLPEAPGLAVELARRRLGLTATG
jgi:putative hydrolase of the HAD superfamily